MTNSLGAVVWRGFQSSYGVPATLIAFGVSVVAWVWPIDEKQVMSLRLVVALGIPLGFGAILLAVALFSAAQTLHTEGLDTEGQLSRARLASPPLPKALFGKVAPNGYTIVLLEPSELFAHGVGVSVYLRNAEDFEELLGVGKVWNVQQDRKIQVVILAADKGASATLAKIRGNDKDILTRLYVKPSVPHDDLIRLQGLTNDDAS